MSWTKVNHSGNMDYIECSSCEHIFHKKEVCYKKSFKMKTPVVLAYTPVKTNLLTEVVCQRCFERRKLKMGKDKTKPQK